MLPEQQIERAGCAEQINVVNAIMTLLPTGGPPISVLQQDVQAGEGLVQVLSGILIPSSLVSCCPQCSAARMRMYTLVAS